VSGIDARFAVGFGAFSLDVDIHVPGQGVTALFGASGCGKTTLLRCIAGLERASGRCRFNGEPWQDDARRLFVPTHRRELGYVFQEASLFPHLSVRGNLEYGWKLVGPRQRRVAFDDAVQLLGLEHLLDRGVGHISGGERQRVAIARALLTTPRLLLMDEPLAALDYRSKLEILPYLQRLHDELAIPVVYVSHDPTEVARLADHMVLLESGRLRAIGPAVDLLTRLDLPLSSFDGATAVIEGTVAGHDETYHLTWIETSAGRLSVPQAEVPAGRRQRVQIHARDVSLARGAHHDSSILNILPAVVTETRECDRTQLLVRLRLEDGQSLLARITRRSGMALGIREGMFIYAQIKSVALVG